MKKIRYALPFLISGIALLAISGFKIFAVVTAKPIIVPPDTSISLHVEKPTKLVLWYYTESVIEGTYTKSKDIPEGLKIEAKFSEQSLPVKIDRGTTVTMGDGERKSMFSIPALETGNYLIRIQNAPPNYRFALTEGSGMQDFFIGFACGGLGSILLVLGVIFLVLALTNVFPTTRTSA